MHRRDWGFEGVSGISVFQFRIVQDRSVIFIRREKLVKQLEGGEEKGIT